ncbi:HFL144Wp [Eremothecium sinecaudum]|uniref:Inheritance of peroxisomes protein 2 n=1 Tax=Eremothecium sinecaudum TaxID=45286 RepID=A0A0X8HUD5_9SACH|nr:HFL144Wp [Eremothecium sinecaudum]AMD21712.1 HFL144Wp [Eremothecium sinecaudum]
MIWKSASTRSQQYIQLDKNLVANQGSNQGSDGVDSAFNNIRHLTSINLQTPTSQTTLELGILNVSDLKPVYRDDFSSATEMVLLDQNEEDLFEFPMAQKTVLDGLVQEIFEESLSLNSELYWEEFHYTIVTSKALNLDGLNSTELLDNSFTKSVKDFRKKLLSSAQRALSLPTKYGRLVIGRKQFFLQRTVALLPVALFSIKCLRKLLQRRGKRKRIVITLLLAMYLALQQEVFHSNYIKYSALTNLKEMVKLLTSLDKLEHNYHIILNELTIFRPITMVQTSTRLPSNIALISDILVSVTDTLYYKLRLNIREILPFVDTEALVRYCEIYNVNLVLLHGFLHGASELSLSDKLQRLRSLKKFWLCLLLSVTGFDTYVTKVSPAIAKMFPGCEMSYLKESDKLKLIDRELVKLNFNLKNAISSFTAYKSCIYDGIISPALNSPIEKTAQRKEECLSKLVSSTFNELQELQNKLLHSQDNDDKLRRYVQEKLLFLHSFWEPVKNEKIIGPATVGVNSTSTSALKRNFGGFALNVISTASEDEEASSFSCEPVTPVIDESAYDKQSTLGDNMASNGTEDVYVTCSEEYDPPEYLKEKFKKLSEEQLKMRLNATINRITMGNSNRYDEIRDEALAVADLQIGTEEAYKGFESRPLLSHHKECVMIQELKERFKG